MNRKPLSILLGALLIMVLVGCTLKAAPDATALPQEEEAMILTAQANSDAMTATAMAQVVTQAPQMTPTPSTSEVSPVATTPPPATTEPVTAVATTPAPVATTPVPVVTTPAPTLTPQVTGPTTHIVQAGENLFRIALRYGLTTEVVAQANGITNPALIYVGQKLTIPAPGGTVTPVPTVTPPPAGNVIVYTVKAGENLFRIALKYNLSYLYLAQYNGIANPNAIYAGQQIRIPVK